MPPVGLTLGAMEARASAVERVREFLSRRSGRIVSPDAAREAADNLLGLFRLLAEWDRRARQPAPEFENREVRGVECVPAPAYSPAASGPRRAAR